MNKLTYKKRKKKDPLNIKMQDNKMMTDMHPATVHFFLIPFNMNKNMMRMNISEFVILLLLNTSGCKYKKPQPTRLLIRQVKCLPPSVIKSK